MSQSILKRYLKFVITAAFIQTPALARADGALPPAVSGKCQVAKKDKCEKDTKLALKLINSNVDAVEGDLQGGAAQMNGASAAAKEASCTAQSSCEEAAQSCRPTTGGCTPKDCDALKTKADDMKQNCENSGNDADHATKTADASRAAPEDSSPQPASSGGGGSSLMPALMGAAVGGLLGYMLGKKSKKDKDDDGALGENGELDCSKDDAYKYQGCNGVLESVCMTALEDPRCVNFANRYCQMSTASGAAVAGDSNSMAFQSTSSASATPGVPGEGIGSPFCKRSLATTYCKTGGRDMCPSCRQLANMSSATCQATPELCLAQNSPSEIEKAKTTCPTDPAFSDPAYLAGGGAQVPGGTTGLPVVVLPGDSTVGGTPTTGTTTTGTGTGASVVVLPSASGSTSGVSTQSVAGSGMREGTPSASVIGSSGDTSAASGTVSTGSSYGTASYTGSSRELASTGGGGTRYASGGPAPDIQGQYGPSVFAVGSTAIRNRCAQQKFNNCP